MDVLPFRRDEIPVAEPGNRSPWYLCADCGRTRLKFDGTIPATVIATCAVCGGTSWTPTENSPPA